MKKNGKKMRRAEGNRFSILEIRGEEFELSGLDINNLINIIIYFLES